MRAFFEDDLATLPNAVAALDDHEARLLWSLRRLALMVPLGSARCQAVHIALQRDFGDAGLGVEHLLRCLLVGLARRSPRRLAFGTPTCAVVTGDESALLALLARPADTAAVEALLHRTGIAALQLLPLFEALRLLVGERQRSC